MGAQLLSYDDHMGRTHGHPDCRANFARTATRPGWWAARVRDLVLGREPKDYDISTDATPGPVARDLSEAPSWWARNSAWCWWTASRWPPSAAIIPIRMAVIRCSSHVRKRSEARRAAARLHHQCVAARSGCLDFVGFLESVGSVVIDYVGGLDDLNANLIRAIGDPEQRFEEDHLRMLRAIRFAARFGFEIEPATLAAIQKLHQRITRVSPERIRDELVRILTEGGARRGFELLDASGLLERHSAGSGRHERRAAAARVSSRRRRLDAHAA